MKLAVLGMTVVLLGGPAVATADKLDDSFQSLKDAVGKKDAAQVKALVAELNPMVKAITTATSPQGDYDEKNWPEHVTYAKSVGEYCEYALFAMAVQAQPAETVDLLSTLEQMNPSSKYMDEAYLQYFGALKQTGVTDAKIAGIAAKGLEHFPNNPDLLLVMMQSTYGKQNDKALNYANRLIAALGKPKPENVSAADWERKRASLGPAHWMAGMIYCSSGTWGPGDRELRAALPSITGNPGMAGPALFYLGMANYQLGKMTLNKAKMLEAVKFSQQSAAIPGQFADQARHNAIVIQSEADRMR